MTKNSKHFQVLLHILETDLDVPVPYLDCMPDADFTVLKMLFNMFIPSTIITGRPIFRGAPVEGDEKNLLFANRSPL